MRISARLFWFLGLVTAIGLVSNGGAWGDPSSRARLDALWEEHMSEGRLSKITIAIRDTGVDVSEGAATDSLDYARGHPESAAHTSYGISVMRLGEGFWGNGGWIVKGGLLGRASHESLTIELYGKAVVRQFAYFPFPFHREIPHETRYEFFLLLRQPGTSGARIVRKWTFTPNEVLVKRETTGGPPEYVQGVLKYDAGSRIATITISGLKRSFEERVELSSTLDAGHR